MKIFLDANVLVTVLNKEYPLFTHAARIISLSDHKKFSVYTSPVCIAIAFYFAEKKSGSQKAKEKIHLLTKNISISSIDEKQVLAAVQNKKVNDLEYGIEYYSALGSKCEVIITEDKNDFYFSEIEVTGCKAFLEKYLM
jgi:predicted nucleic acid-binding protein